MPRMTDTVNACNRGRPTAQPVTLIIIIIIIIII